MKKILTVLLTIVGITIITGCGSSKSNSYEDLLDGYIKAYTKADVSIVNDIFPPFYMEYAVGYLTKDYLEEKIKKDKEIYGDDFNITYEVGKKEKVSEEDLNKLNENMEEYFETREMATECYKYEGTITYKGSKKEDNDPLSAFLYCKYGNEWYLVRN